MLYALSVTLGCFLFLFYCVFNFVIYYNVWLCNVLNFTKQCDISMKEKKSYSAVFQIEMDHSYTVT